MRLVCLVRAGLVMQAGHRLAAGMVQSYEHPVLVVEHRAAGVTPFRGRPVVQLLVVRIQLQAVVEGESEAAATGIADHVEP